MGSNIQLESIAISRDLEVGAGAGNAVNKKLSTAMLVVGPGSYKHSQRVCYVLVLDLEIIQDALLEFS